jgi:hypothetical protein
MAAGRNIINMQGWMLDSVAGFALPSSIASHTGLPAYLISAPKSSAIEIARTL